MYQLQNNSNKINTPVQMDVNSGLHCNYKRCLVSLKNIAWITSCAHVFCDEHSPASKDTKICPLCSTSLERYDIIKKRINPTEAEKGIMLAGLNPTTIFEIGSKSMGFLKFQAFQEKLFLTSLGKNLKRRLAQAESTIATMTEKIHKQAQQESQKYYNMNNELGHLNQKIKLLEQEINTKNRQLYNLTQMLSQKPQTPSTNHFQPVDSSQSNLFNTKYDYKENRKNTHKNDDEPMFRSQQCLKRNNMKTTWEMFQ